MRGAWIEILKKVNLMANNPVAPRGLKYKPKVAQFNFYGRSPCGERGLK